MPVNIGQTLLQNAEERQLSTAAKTAHVTAKIELGLNPAARGKSIEVPGDRRLQAHLLQHRRVEEIRNSSNFFDRGLGELYAFRDLLSGWVLGADSSGQRIQVDLNRRERLAKAIVQFSPNPSALLVLGAEQVPGQLPEGVLRIVQSSLGFSSLNGLLSQCLLRLHAFREIASDFRKSNQFAGIIVNGRDHYARPKPGTIFAKTPALIEKAPFLGGDSQFPVRLAPLQVFRGIEA